MQQKQSQHNAGHVTTAYHQMTVTSPQHSLKPIACSSTARYRHGPSLAIPARDEAHVDTFHPN